MNEILNGTELTCQQIIELLNAYLDDELSSRERRIFDLHLSLCPDCVAYFESYQLTRKLLRNASELPGELPELPAELVQAIICATLERPNT